MFISAAFFFDINVSTCGKQVVERGSKQAIYSPVNVPIVTVSQIVLGCGPTVTENIHTK